MLVYNRKILYEVLNNNGIFFDEDSLDQPLEMDSLTFVTLIVDIENSFGIIYPQEYMVYDKALTLLQLEEVIKSLLIQESVV
jgi:acyl carrier protein